MNLEHICYRLKAKIPQKFDLFSNQRPIQNITINNGLVKINSNLIHGNTRDFEDDVMTVVGSPITYEDVGLNVEWVNYAHKINNNCEYEIPQKYINYTLDGGTLHTDIRVHHSPSREIALEDYKVTPKNMIYLVEGDSKYSVGTNYSMTDTDNLLIERNFSILVYLYNKNDRLQQDNLKIIKEIEKVILGELRGFEYKTIYDNISNVTPIDSTFSIVTRNTIVLDMRFKLFEDMYCATTDTFAYRLDLVNPVLENVVIDDRDFRKDLEIKKDDVVVTNRPPYKEDYLGK